MRHRLFLIFLIGVGSGPIPAFSADSKPLEEQAQEGITPGDVIQLEMSPDEYSREVTVQADGQIQMPLIGTVMVKGLTISELQRLILNKYARYMANPRVMASVRRFSGRRVAILGEVRGPGYYDYREGMGLLELVSLAGGLNPDARASRVRILRKGEKERSFAVNFKAVLEGDLSRDPLLAPGDTVIVPQQPFTSGGAWVNRNILPWAAIFSMIGTIAVITAR